MSDPKTSEVIVIGAGCMGAAATWAIAARGATVTTLDQFTSPHARGSSHGQSRIFRVAYFEHPDYVPLLKRARTQWMELNHVAAEPVFIPSGGLWMGRDDRPFIRGTLHACAVHGLAHEVFDHRAIAQRHPHIRMREGFGGFFEADAGVVRPERTIAHMLRASSASGAHLRMNERVIRWTTTETGVRVETDQATYEAAKLIVTAGPWTRNLLPDLPFSLRITRQPVAWFRVRDPARFQPANMPCFAVEKGRGGFYYGFPLVEGADALKVALHEPGETTHPDSVDRHVSDDEIDAFRRVLDETFPGLIGELLRTDVCLYTNTEDGHFVIDRHPLHERVIIACGFSGHGFKFAPVVGEALADLALEGATHLPIGFLSCDRFGSM